MALGDVTSTERGSGARYNDGKAPLELIPLRLIVDTLDPSGFSEEQEAVGRALVALGRFQEGGIVEHLHDALRELDYDGRAWELCADVFSYGRFKYAAWNWAKGMSWSAVIGCAGRHGLAVLKGEVFDPIEKKGSGREHRGHLMCNLVMLATFYRTYPEGDDRPPASLFQPTTPAIPADPHFA
jgi:hypothetical protein